MPYVHQYRPSLARYAILAEVMRWADVMLQKVAAVVQDLQDEKEGRRLSEQILPQAEAFQVAPAMRGQVAARSGPTTMFSEGDIGILPPLGVWDPLGYIDSRDMRRYEEMEIKHGRAAMLGFLHVILTEAGLRDPASPRGRVLGIGLHRSEHKHRFPKRFLGLWEGTLMWYLIFGFHFA